MDGASDRHSGLELSVSLLSLPPGTDERQSAVLPDLVAEESVTATCALVRR